MVHHVYRAEVFVETVDVYRGCAGSIDVRVGSEERTALRPQMGSTLAVHEFLSRLSASGPGSHLLQEKKRYRVDETDQGFRMRTHRLELFTADAYIVRLSDDPDGCVTVVEYVPQSSQRDGLYLCGEHVIIQSAYQPVGRAWKRVSRRAFDSQGNPITNPADERGVEHRGGTDFYATMPEHRMDADVYTAFLEVTRGRRVTIDDHITTRDPQSLRGKAHAWVTGSPHTITYQMIVQ